METYPAAMHDVEGEEELEREIEQNELHPPPLKRNTPSIPEKEELLRFVYLIRTDKSVFGCGWTRETDDCPFLVGINCSKLSCLRSLWKGGWEHSSDFARPSSARGEAHDARLRQEPSYRNTASSRFGLEDRFNALLYSCFRFQNASGPDQMLAWWCFFEALRKVQKNRKVANCGRFRAW